MGLYNLVIGPMVCPRCGKGIEAEVETRLGQVANLARLHVGSQYPWNRAGRPEEGNAVGDGYCVCPVCEKDFFVNVVVVGDVIDRLEVDRTRAGYVV